MHNLNHNNIIYSLGLSAHLNHGHISPIEVLVRIANVTSVSNSIKELFFDRILVLREISINNAWFDENYDQLMDYQFPKWVIDTAESLSFKSIMFACIYLIRNF